MFLGVDAEGGGLWRDAKGFDSWRTPGVIHSVHETFDKDLVMPVKAESCRDGRPAKPAGFRVEAGYMIFDDGKFLMVGTIYREDGSAETPLVLTRGDTVPQNRTSVVPLMRGKSALLLLNRSGQLPIFAGVYDSSDLITSSASKQAGSEARPDGFQATTWVRMAAGGWLCFAPTYRVDGSVDPPHTLKCEGGEIENQTQVVDLWGGASALVLADPKTKTPLLKGIYPNDQLHPSSAGILLTERYLSLEGEILSLDTVYGPANPARFVGARLGDRPIQNRGQMIELAGNRSAVFTADPHSTEGVPRFAGIQDTKVCPPVR